MGGLRKRIPFTFWVFLIGSLGLVAFPLTSGFFSKDQILFQAWAYGHHEFYWMGLAGAFMRSEEHTSELQSLMRISYAVFCLKKKRTHTKMNMITMLS